MFEKHCTDFPLIIERVIIDFIRYLTYTYWVENNE